MFCQVIFQCTSPEFSRRAFQTWSLDTLQQRKTITDASEEGYMYALQACTFASSLPACRAIFKHYIFVLSWGNSSTDPYPRLALSLDFWSIFVVFQYGKAAPLIATACRWHPRSLILSPTKQWFWVQRWECCCCALTVCPSLDVVTPAPPLLLYC